MKQVFLCILLLFVFGCSSGPDDLASLFPGSIGPMERVKLMTGEEALTAINQLHGKSIHALDGAIGAYQAKGAAGSMVWVSRASGGQAAREQVAIMMEKMLQSSTSPFANPSDFRRAGVDVYQLEGMGQLHSLYSTGELVWWIAAEEADMGLLLDEFLPEK